MRDRAKMSADGRIGGNKTKEQYGREFFAKIGRVGGRATKERHDSLYYSQIGKMGGRGNRRKGARNASSRKQ